MNTNALFLIVFACLIDQAGPVTKPHLPASPADHRPMAALLRAVHSYPCNELLPDYQQAVQWLLGEARDGETARLKPPSTTISHCRLQVFVFDDNSTNFVKD